MGSKTMIILGVVIVIVIVIVTLWLVFNKSENFTKAKRNKQKGKEGLKRINIKELTKKTLASKEFDLPAYLTALTFLHRQEKDKFTQTVEKKYGKEVVNKTLTDFFKTGIKTADERLKSFNFLLKYHGNKNMDEKYVEYLRDLFSKNNYTLPEFLELAKICIRIHLANQRALKQLNKSKESFNTRDALITAGIVIAIGIVVTAAASTAPGTAVIATVLGAVEATFGASVAGVVATTGATTAAKAALSAMLASLIIKGVEAATQDALDLGSDLVNGRANPSDMQLGRNYLDARQISCPGSYTMRIEFSVFPGAFTRENDYRNEARDMVDAAYSAYQDEEKRLIDEASRNKICGHGCQKIINYGMKRGSIRRDSDVSSPLYNDVLIEGRVDQYGNPLRELTGWKFRVDSSISCRDCPGTSITDPNDYEKCMTCPAGFGINANRDQCINCSGNQAAAGTISINNINRRICIDCGSIGQVVNDDNTGCTTCPEGQISQLVGANSDLRTIGGDQYSCQQCPEGTISARVTRAGTGTVSSQCQPCTRNTITTDNIRCKPCTGTTIPNARRTRCVECPEGQITVDNENCRTCTQNTIPNSDRSGCVECPSGQITYDNRRCQEQEHECNNVIDCYRGQWRSDICSCQCEPGYSKDANGRCTDFDVAGWFVDNRTN